MATLELSRSPRLTSVLAGLRRALGQQRCRHYRRERLFPTHQSYPALHLRHFAHRQAHRCAAQGGGKECGGVSPSVPAHLRRREGVRDSMPIRNNCVHPTLNTCASRWTPPISSRIRLAPSPSCTRGLFNLMRWVANIPIADANMDRVPCQGLIDAGVATIGESLGSGINRHSSYDGRRYCGSSTHIR